MASVMKSVSSGLNVLTKPKDATSLGLLVAAVVCAIIPLDISQLMFAIAGAIGFSVVQILQSKARSNSFDGHGKKMPSPAYNGDNKRTTPKSMKTLGAHSQAPQRQQTKNTNNSHLGAARPASQPEVRKPSNVPILAPTFTTTDWDSQISELLVTISPTTDDDRIVAKLARRIETAIQPLIPEVEVVGFASGSLGRNKAFGVAVPEVDIVANISPSVLVSRMGHAKNSDARKLRKSAIRACTECLVSSGGFKFRRSAFRGEEPKVTLLAPASFGLSDDAIPIDFSVNAASPLQNAALLTECGQMEPRARALILLIKRWTKDRGICHAAKGHLAPYVWGILSIFFLQVGNGEEPYLPKLQDFKMASGLMKHPVSASKPSTWTQATSKKTVGTLFKEFIHFYNTEFDWRTEVVSIRAGSRQKPGINMPLHVIVHDDGQTTEVGPSIEDPFDEMKNLATCTHATSLLRLREELARADKLNSEGASLANLLEPWAPPESPALVSEE